MTQEEIVTELSTEFQEKEIHDVLKWLSRPEEKGELRRLKTVLKISLWALLTFKLLSLFSLVAGIEGMGWRILVLVIGPGVNILALILVYKETESAYPIVFILLLLGISQVSETFGSFLDSSVGSAMIVLNIVQVVTFAAATFSSFRLWRELPGMLIRIRKEAKIMNLDFSEIAQSAKPKWINNN